MFQLQYNDILLAGSDGREDIQITDQAGVTLIQENPDFFINCVNESGPELQSIFDIISSKGILTDDFSMIRIKYIGKDDTETTQVSDSEIAVWKKNISDVTDSKTHIYQLEEKLVQFPGHIFWELNLIKAYMNSGYYRKALDLLFLSFAENQKNNQLLYLIALCYFYMEEYDAGIEYSERLRLREPSYIENIMLLAKMHFQIRQFDRYKEITKECIAMDKDNPDVRKLEQEMLEL